MIEPVAILGVGMHPWGKWGRNFVEYGCHAARAALADAGVDWKEVEVISGGNTMRNGYPGYVAGSTFAQALGFNGCQTFSTYAACATGATALSVARGQILAGVCDLALVVAADTTPKGFFAPNEGTRPNDPDWLRFRLIGATNPIYFALAARRRMELYGATADDFARVKIKNSRHGQHNPNARYTKVFTKAEIDASPMVADPLRLLDICATSDGAAAVVLSSMAYARHRGVRNPVRISGISLHTPRYPNPDLELPYLATDSSAADPPSVPFKSALASRAYEESGIAPEDVHVAEVYDLSTAMELDWYEQLLFCAAGEAEKLLADGTTEIGGRLPVNPSGGLAAFGEAPPAQALAQVCELVWQLRGEAGDRTVQSARVGVAANQGLFAHGSCVVVNT